MTSSILEEIVRPRHRLEESRHALRPPLFYDRRDAGQKLAAMFGHQQPESVAVVGLARGGVVTAAEIARALDAPLDGLAVRKIRHPWLPELAIGTVAPDGEVELGPVPGLTDAQVTAAIAHAKREVALLDESLHAEYRALDIDGHKVILVDDGMATGATMLAAARWARRHGAAQVVVATPVASVEGLRRVLRVATETMCLHTLSDLTSVGAWYGSFTDVDTDAVIALILENRTLQARRER